LRAHFCAEVTPLLPVLVFSSATNQLASRCPALSAAVPNTFQPHTMEGVDLTKAMLNKGKQMANVAASAANGSGGKKRRKGTDLKPIVTNDAAGEPTELYVNFFPAPHSLDFPPNSF